MVGAEALDRAGNEMRSDRLYRGWLVQCLWTDQT